MLLPVWLFINCIISICRELECCLFGLFELIALLLSFNSLPLQIPTASVIGVGVIVIDTRKLTAFLLPSYRQVDVRAFEKLVF
ncbi:hypothetical protein VNO78_08264 [Psophocarpus tetragonolobus]|uniref:Uncharacterized protein n=1 Tax=Psophocarpus tetragonolobus TaxID=3891 RepID=A0AAN9SVR5_PSOTE